MVIGGGGNGSYANDTGTAAKLMSQSATNLAVSRNDSVSPSALSTLSTGAPVSIIGRNRSSTFNKLTRYLRSSVGSSAGSGAAASAAAASAVASVQQAKEQQQQQQTNQTHRNHAPPPQIFVSTKSLPESLTSTNPSILAGCCPNSLTPTISRHTSDRGTSASDHSKATDSVATTPTYAPTIESTNKSSSIAANLRNKLPKYLRKFENRNNNNGIKCDKDCVINESSMPDGNRTADNDVAYQLLPIIVQQSHTETSLNALDPHVNNTNRDGNLLETPSCSPSPRSTTNINLHIKPDLIDVRSYISQSRSDITPFYPERSDSCKYRSHRSFYGDISPMRRPRSKTVALTSQEHINNKMSSTELRVPNALHRKHSHHCGPTSNSLRLPDMAPNHTSISQERLSTGDLASWVSNISDDPMSADQSSAIAIPPNDAIHLDPIRKQSDIQLVKCVKENAKSQQNYFMCPPISKVTLFFTPTLEREFREEAHQLNKWHGPLTIALPIYNTYFDIFIGVVIFATVSLAMFLLTASEKFNESKFIWIWRCFFGAFTLIELFTFVLFTKKLFRNQWKMFSVRLKTQDTELQKQSSSPPPPTESRQSQRPSDVEGNVEPIKLPPEFQKATSDASSITISSTLSASYRMKRFFEDKLISSISTWYRWHLSLGFLMSLPAILTLTHFLISNMTNDASVFGCHYGFLMIICIIHFCNFTQLNCWMRSILALLVALAFIGGISIHEFDWMTDTSLDGSIQSDQFNATNNIIASQSMSNRTQSYIDRKKLHCFEKRIDLEIYLDLVLVLVLVWFLNREFEIFYRFAFYSSSIAEKDKIRVQQMKNQADLLLTNIIPKHVSEHLKNTAKYSENHHNVAIIFASLINFNELYDESYLGGREYLRVLNELIGDFDELLSRPEFSCVEKIKTIGSTFMSASGLDNNLRDDNVVNSHINALMEFALAMQEVVDAFNKDLLEFDLILRIGFNVGDVTAGVIGSSKLHFDIWGDAVNVSSRMDSTGVPGRIQIGKDCIPFLDSERYEFEPRGIVAVKGKDDMEVFLVKRKRLDESMK